MQDAVASLPASAKAEPAADGITAVIDALRSAITSGRFMPNEHLVEAELCRSLDTNRAIVRTALVVLEAEGLVSREPNRGAKVKLISEEEALEIAEVRIELEVLSARLAATRITESECAELRQIVDSMRERYEKKDFRAISQLNAALHAGIAAATHNETLIRMLSHLKHQLVRIQYRALYMSDRATLSLEEHAAIVEALCQNDPELAARRMREHVELFHENLKATLNHGL